MMYKFLEKNYQFRVNALRERTEWRRSSEDEWRELDDRGLNTIYFELLRAGFSVGIKDVERYLYSEFVTAYHPFRDYLDALPAWDGKDRVRALARRVSKEALWITVFHRWLRALTAQWMDLEMQTANAMVPVLVSQKQGLGKSTFWRMLMPPELSAYYLDKLDFTATGEYDRMMAQCGLINLDEIDSFTDRAMAKFKAATQMKTITGHSIRTSRITFSARLASFCATTNKVGILHDSTGSRRFFCVDVLQKINCTTPINHAQIFAQLKAELAAGEPTWFTKREEKRIERNNARYYRLTPLQKALLADFRAPDDDVVAAAQKKAASAEENQTAAEEVQELTSTEIFRTVARRHPSMVAGMRLAEFGKQVTRLFPSVKRQGRGNVYRVVPLAPLAA